MFCYLNTCLLLKHLSIIRNDFFTFTVHWISDCNYKNTENFLDLHDHLILQCFRDDILALLYYGRVQMFLAITRHHIPIEQLCISLFLSSYLQKAHYQCALDYFSLGVGYLVAQMVKNLPEYVRPGFNPWVKKIPWRREQLPTPLFLPGEFHGLEPGSLQSMGSQESETTE